ncbi:MAG: redoxin domain-containing protein [Candidatus Binatus sp.]|uniref:TlpA family protein disulfide reductase n=1 Tax=Candidatus Binatus sp. TaxID=2811406 RepID=UPI002723E161|nr:redoxin domain-containing protein [Candidatus Binatus sp.]MDO8434785.1 redoxin domain-containing protein [Candidatus Binatus sp.]
MPESSTSPLPQFNLADAQNAERSFPTGRAALLCFVKEDCPTCGMSMALIEAAHRAFGAKLDVLSIGQDAEGNAKLVERYALSVPMLDDSALAVSFAYDLDTVPTIILADANGVEQRRFIGFGRDDWREMFAELSRIAGTDAPSINWNEYPESRPGCGSKSVEPGVAEKLEAAARGEFLTARRIELGDSEDVFEFMFERGLTDGLPVVPPTPERVMRMLTGTRRDPREVVATVPPNLAPVTVEKIAVNAVMAGCKPEHLPVVIAALEAVCTDEFNIHGVMATTWGATPVIVVNGPIRHRLGMNMGMMALGYGNRANATIGRALKLVLRNVGGARPGEIERSTLGAIGKFTTCFAEWEERSAWEPLHVERGFKKEENVVTVFGLEAGSRQIADQMSRTAHALVGSIGLGLEACWHPKQHGSGEILLVVSPEHVDTIARDKWSKAQVRARIQEITSRPLRELMPDAESGEGVPPKALGFTNPTAEQLATKLPKFRKPENINMIVAGGEAGKFSAVFAGWVSGPMGSSSVSRRIEEAP